MSVAIKVKLLNRFQFHQLQLKTNKNSCTGGSDAQRHPLFDNAVTRRRWSDGGGGENTRPVQQMICNHSDLPVDLLGKTVSGQDTAHNVRADREVSTEVRRFSLIISKASNRSVLTAASARVPISRINSTQE